MHLETERAANFNESDLIFAGEKLFCQNMVGVCFCRTDGLCIKAKEESFETVICTPTLPDPQK
jgi:hypothetical protein